MACRSERQSTPAAGHLVGIAVTGEQVHETHLWGGGGRTKFARPLVGIVATH